MAKPFERDIPWYPGEPPRELPTAETSALNDPVEMRYAEYLYLRGIPLELPKRARARLPKGTLDIVNRSLGSSFDWAYNKAIPPLRDIDVFVVTSESLAAHHQHHGAKVTHPLRVRLGLEIKRIKPEAIVEPDYVFISTAHELPYKPIYYPDSGLHVVREDEGTAAHDPFLKAKIEALELATVAKILIHESIHRATKGTHKVSDTIPIGPENPLVEMAFASDRHALSTARDENVKEHLTSMIEELMDYAMNHQPAVAIEGARIRLYCRDKIGEFGSIAESGYDLNEAVVEILTNQALPPLFAQIRQRYGIIITGIVEELVREASFRSAGSSRQQNLLLEVLPYMDRLGLHTPEEALNAYADGKIPYLHIQHLSGQPYYT